MDIDGNKGPTAKKIFFCDRCEWLGDGYQGNKSCYHPEIIDSYNNDTEIIYRIFMGNIDKDLKTPLFCPYLAKKMRYEKIKKLNG